MAQAIWQFVSNTGTKHKIGLYHGDTSGHLLIYCGKQVVKVDFMVKQGTEYSFFVDEEFCRVVLHKERNGTFSYEFLVDKEADTPLNTERKTVNRRNTKWLWALGVGLLLVVGGFYFGTRAWQRHLGVQNSGWAGVMYMPDKEAAKALHASGVKTEARLYLKPDGKQIEYAFVTQEGTEITGTLTQPEQAVTMLPNGFQLFDNDTYQLRYLAESPKTHMIDFMAPTQAQVGRFAERALAVESRKSENKITQSQVCFVRCVLEEAGWEQLQHVINQFVTPTAHATYNSDSYLRLCREPKFEREWQGRCWDK